MSAPSPVTIITGASAGIGVELARVFARNGHRLVLVARRGDKLGALADEIAAAGQTRPEVIALDLSIAGAADALGHELAARQLEPAVIVNNAGYGLTGRADELPRAEQLGMVDLNVRALTELSLAFVDSLARHKGGILNVASLASFLPAPGMAIYYATKAYVLSFSEALHAELRKKGVRVTALCPGPVPTEFQARAGLPEQAARRPARIVGGRGRRSRLSRICGRQAAGRAGTPEQAYPADAADFPAGADPDGIGGPSEAAQNLTLRCVEALRAAHRGCAAARLVNVSQPVTSEMVAVWIAPHR